MGVRIPQTTSNLVTLQDAAVATGNGTALAVIGNATVAFQTTIATTATVTYEGTVDGTTYVSLQTMNPADGSVATTSTASGVRIAPCAGLQKVRARISSWTDGAVTVTARTLPIGNGLTLADVDIAGSESVTVTQVTPGTAATDLGKAEDAAHTSGDVGVMALGVRKDTAASLAGTDGDYTAPIFDVNGRQHVIEASAAAIAASLAIVDDWDETDRAKVNPIAGQAGVAAGAGAVGVTTQRTTLASDDPAVVALQIIDDWDESDRAKVNPIAGQVGVAGGTGVDGATVQRVTLATDVALPAGTNNIGDVDVLSSALPTGASTLAEQQTQTTSLQLLDDVVVTDDAANSTSAVLIAGSDSVNVHTLLTDSSGRLKCDVTNVVPGAGATDLGKAEDAAASSGDTGVMALAVRNDALTALSGTDLDYTPMAVTSSGVGFGASVPTGSSVTAPSNATTTANDDSAVVKASAGVLYGLTGYNAKASAQFILFFNSTTVPADTAQAVLVVTVPASSNFSVDFGRYGRYFSTGIAWSNSSTQPLKTVGSADVHLDAQYV